MFRILVVLITVLLLVATGCTGKTLPAVTVIEDGCLTASGDRFVLTDLESGEPHPSLKHNWTATRPRPTTEAYVLEGDDDPLRNLVGRRVRVVGEAVPEQIVEIHQMSPRVRVRPANTPVGAEGVTPAVGDYAVLRLEVHRLRVMSAYPTGDDCTTEFRHRA